MFVMMTLLHMPDGIFIADPPVDMLSIVCQYLGQGSGPTATADNTNAILLAHNANFTQDRKSGTQRRKAALI